MRRLLGDLSQNSFTPHSGTYQGVGWENLITSAALIALSIKVQIDFSESSVSTNTAREVQTKQIVLGIPIRNFMGEILFTKILIKQ